MPTTVPSDLPAALGGWLSAGIPAMAAVGAVMLLWGRLLHRALLVLVAASIGLLVAARYGPQIGLGVFVSQLAGAVTGGLLAVVLARLVWAVLAAVHVAAVVSTVVVVWYLGVDLAGLQPAAQGDVIARGEAFAEQVVRAVWAQHGLTVGITVILAGLAGLVVAFVLPRVTVILMTSLIGTGLLSAAAGLAMVMWLPALLPAPSPASRYVMCGIGGGVLLVGIVFQSVGEVRARRRKAEQADESGPRSQKSSGRAGGKGE